MEQCMVYEKVSEIGGRKRKSVADCYQRPALLWNVLWDRRGWVLLPQKKTLLHCVRSVVGGKGKVRIPCCKKLG